MHRYRDASNWLDSDSESDSSSSSSCSTYSSSDYEPSYSGDAYASDDSMSSDGQNPPTNTIQQPQWSSTIRPPRTDRFLGLQPQGPTPAADVIDVESPAAFFGVFFDDCLLKHIVLETNRYASQRLAQSTPTPSSRLRDWKETTTEEIKSFIGLVLLTGLVSKRGSLENYWSTRKTLTTPFFGETLSRNRFQILSTFLHFNNNMDRAANADDKLFKVRPVLDNLTEKWKRSYNLGEQLSIDEAMLNWQGRVPFKVFMKNKPIKHGIKSYVLANAKTFYCWNISIYKRDKKTIKETVLNLLTPKCYGIWHSLYMDNFYNSVSLSEALLEKKIHTVGTLRCFRGEPLEIRKPSRMKTHEVVARDNGKVVVMAWKDKRIVKAITTKHDSSLCYIERRKRGGHGEVESIPKPCAIDDYNQNMSGVDQMDQMLAYYQCTRKSMKWTKKLFFYLTEICVHNAFILYKIKSVNATHNSYFKFIVCLVEELCSQQSDSSTRTATKYPRLNPSSRLLGGFDRHQLQPIPSSSTNPRPRRRCKLCAKSGIRKDVFYFCSNCDVALCPSPCYGLYHTKLHL